jgi:hypothetical protein
LNDAALMGWVLVPATVDPIIIEPSGPLRGDPASPKSIRTCWVVGEERWPKRAGSK